MTERPAKTWTIMQVLEWTRGHFENKGLASPRLDAEVLIAHALGLARVMLYAKFDQPLRPHELDTIRALVARRSRGEPVAHLTGRREFWSLDLDVTADTLIPRPDTETLVEVALALVPPPRRRPAPAEDAEGAEPREDDAVDPEPAPSEARSGAEPREGGGGALDPESAASEARGGGRSANPGPAAGDARSGGEPRQDRRGSADPGPSVFVDVGTGTGAIALALAAEHKAARVWATDVSEAALAVARQSAERLGLAERVTFVQGDLLDALPPDVGPIDLLVSNLPYIPSGDITHLMPDVRLFEPRLALDGGPDGLDLIRRLVDQLAGRLAPKAKVVLEAGHDQLDAVAALLREAGAAEVTITRDPGGHPRVAAGVWP